MKMSIKELRTFIAEILTEADWKWSGREAEEREADATKYDDKTHIKSNSSYGEYMGNRDKAFEDEIHELMEQPEFASVDDFVEMKMQADDTSFTSSELQALARVATQKKLMTARVTTANVAILKQVKEELLSYGFSFKAREPVKFVRGSRSSAHGSSPYAGMGGGGSGFGTSTGDPKGGPVGTSFGGGPGAMGGGYTWDPNDPKNLAMGAKRRK